MGLSLSTSPTTTIHDGNHESSSNDTTKTTDDSVNLPADTNKAVAAVNNTDDQTNKSAPRSIAGDQTGNIVASDDNDSIDSFGSVADETVLPENNTSPANPFTLSTPSTTPVSNPVPWFWQDENGDWIKYGEYNTKTDSKSLITSNDIEDYYQTNPDKNFQFKTSEGQSYTLDFKNNVQINDKYGTKKKISRGQPVTHTASSVRSSLPPSPKSIHSAISSNNVSLPNTPLTNKKTTNVSSDNDVSSDSDSDSSDNISLSGLIKGATRSPSPLSNPVPWFWQDENGDWIKYGEYNTKTDSKSLITSNDIEDYYQTNPDKNFQFKTSEGQSYTLDFKNNLQINDKYGTKKKICRGQPKNTTSTNSSSTSSPTSSRSGSISSITNISLGKTSLLTQNTPTKESTTAQSSSAVKWFFKDENDKWIEYGQTNSKGTSKSTITSSDIEHFYQSNPSKNFQFKTSEGQSYTLDFKKGYQINDEHGTKKDIKREDETTKKAPPSGVQWYFEDEHQNWIEYGKSNTKTNTKSTVTSDDIEQFYQTNPGKDFQFTASNGQSYKLDFQNGFQINEKYGTKRKVKRGNQALGVMIDQSNSAVNPQPPQNVSWYWKDEHGNWNKYGEENTRGSAKALITSSGIEKLYQQNNHGTATFKSSEGQEYKLDFSNNCQVNVKYRTKKDIKRVLDSKTTYPLHWDAMQDKEEVKIIDIDQESDEFLRISKLFENCSGGPKCKTLKRIQNKKIWKIFQTHRESMITQYDSKEKVNEQLLFHGSKYDLINKICKENLDSRKRGVNGTLFGQGVYFAKKSSYSVRYAESSSSGAKAMFLFRVLVGTVTEGSSKLMYPPYTKDNPDIQYDTTVDSESNPTVFVKYYDHTYYPEYVIEF